MVQKMMARFEEQDKQQVWTQSYRILVIVVGIETSHGCHHQAGKSFKWQRRRF